MNKFLLVLIVVLSQVISVFAQENTGSQSPAKDDGEIKTLFKHSNHVKIGYYISPEGDYTQFKGRDVFLGGLSLGVIINHFFSVGLSAKGILNSGNLWYEFDVPLDAPSGAYLYGGYGGVKFEFKLFSTSPVHINFPILIGGGGLTFNTWKMHGKDYQNNNNYNGTTLDWDAFFVVEPGVMVELNLMKFMQLDAGVTYRYTPDLDLMQTSAGLINNFNAVVALKFGKF